MMGHEDQRRVRKGAGDSDSHRDLLLLLETIIPCIFTLSERKIKDRRGRGGEKEGEEKENKSRE